MRYQFQVDGQPVGPVRKFWVQAASDVIAGGCGKWASDEAIFLYPDRGGHIEELEE